MGQFAVGQSVPREEDPRLLRGGGDFIADRRLPDMAYAHLLRSPHAHARIAGLDAARARAMPGVLGVFTIDDLKADGIGLRSCHIPRKRPDGRPMLQAPHPGLADGVVRFAGEPVALVVAENRELARDAAEAIEVGYEPFASVVSSTDAIAPGAPLVWDACEGNVSNLFELGDGAAVDAAFARASHVTRQRFVVSRIGTHPIEPRGCIGEYDAREDRYTLYGCIGTPYAVRRVFAGEVFRIPENRLRVVCTETGGCFGYKGEYSSENILALWAARRVGRPVKWVADRSESFTGHEHARDNVTDAELALDAEGHFLALRVRTLANLGAYLSTDLTILPTFANLGTLAGVYRTPAIHVTVTGVMTHTVPTAPARGAGRPEACYVIEGIIDRAARELGMDRIELRRRNTIPTAAMPFKTGLVYTYDCGEFEKNMDATLQMADCAGFESRRARARGRARLRGLGVANAIERAASPPGSELAEIRFDPSGGVTLLVGSVTQGQGHETMYKILLSDTLGIDSSQVRLIQGDTDKVAWGAGTFGSRVAALGGSAVFRAAQKVIDKGRRIAAHLMEAAVADIEFSRGIFSVAGTDRRIALADVARASFEPNRMPPDIQPGLIETGVFEPKAQTFPNGCHVCELEIEEETGTIEILRYAVVDDVGTVINELTLHGQMHGGIVMGAGQALFENMVYDAASGQLLTGSFMDYCMPRAADFCDIEVESNPVPTRQNPLGVKGAGEAGTVGALPAVMNAALDALAPLGVRHIEMPLSPERVWRAIREARSGHS